MRDVFALTYRLPSALGSALCRWTRAAVMMSAVLMAAAASDAVAHPVASDTTKPDVVRYGAVGTHAMTAIDDLNDALGAAGYSTTHSTTLALGGGAYKDVGPGLTLGLEGHGLVGFENTEGRRDAPIGAGYGFGNLGYPVVRTSAVRLHPFAGLGLGVSAVRFDLTDRKRDRNFQDVLADPDRTSTLVQGALLVQAGVGLEYRFDLDTRLPMMPLERGLLGLRAGYVLAPATTDWSLGQGTDLAGGPDAAPSGPYVRLILGGF